MKRKIYFKIWVIALFIWGFFAVGKVLAANNNRENYAILPYGAHSSAIMDWITARFSYAIGGQSAPGEGVTWTTYVDATNLGSISELLAMKDWATTNGLNYEEVLLHAKIDFTYVPSYSPYRAWTQMDKFDNFEGAKGVMRTADDLTYADLTSTAYNGSVTWQNTMYLGYEEAFDQINLVLANQGQGINKIWEFWNGSSWATLTVNDGTNNFANSGQIYFVPPSNWSRGVVNASRNKYFVRCRIISASSDPITSSIKGDTWLRGGDLLVRGWDPTSVSIVNSGELSYNPTPPAGASAKFHYQARIPMWNDNHFIGNPADIQTIGGTSVHSWAKYVAYASATRIASNSGISGVMLDDGAFSLSVSHGGVDPANTDFADKTTDTWQVAIKNRNHEITLNINSINSAYLVGMNTDKKTDALQMNFNLAEWYASAYQTWGATVDYSAGNTIMSYDDYLPAHNPADVKGLLGYTDPADVVASSAMWDRSNRGPIACLSHYLIGKNSNTLFWYDTHGATYGETDEVILKDDSTWHMATQGIPLLENVQRWSNWFPAMAVDFGLPDVSGYNGGARNLVWKPLNSVGDVMPVFRRDYTNAVILHRPASFSSTATHFNTPSTALDLGGTYYPLFTDGKTGPAVTSVTLRTGEGAILMKSPIGVDAIAPSAPTGLGVI